MTEEFKIEIPEKITKKLYINLGVGVANFNKISIDQYNYSVLEDWTLLKTQEVEFDLSEIEGVNENSIKQELKENLEDQQEKIKAEAYIKISEIQDRIDTLLAIEHTPEGE